MDRIFKPYRRGTIEEYPYRVNYTVNGGMFYMNVHAEDETAAAEKVKNQYFEDDDEIEIMEVISKL